MATEEEMLAGAEQLVRDLQHTVRSGITKTEKWRVQQLRALLKLVVENQDSLANAVFTDLGKPTHETVIYEVQTLSLSAFALETPNWMSLEARFMQAVDKLDVFKLQLVFQKKLANGENTEQSCMRVLQNHKASIHELKCKI